MEQLSRPLGEPTPEAWLVWSDYCLEQMDLRRTGRSYWMTRAHCARRIAEGLRKRNRLFLGIYAFGSSVGQQVFTEEHPELIRVIRWIVHPEDYHVHYYRPGIVPPGVSLPWERINEYRKRSFDLVWWSSPEWLGSVKKKYASDPSDFPGLIESNPTLAMGFYNRIKLPRNHPLSKKIREPIESSFR